MRSRVGRGPRCDVREFEEAVDLAGEFRPVKLFSLVPWGGSEVRGNGESAWGTLLAFTRFVALCNATFRSVWRLFWNHIVTLFTSLWSGQI